MSSSAIRQTVNVMISEVAVYRYVHSQSSPFEQHGPRSRDEYSYTFTKDNFGCLDVSYVHTVGIFDVNKHGVY